MLKTFVIGLSIIVLTSTPNHVVAQPWQEHGKLGVLKDNPHYLGYSDGTPFVWIGDTGWELIHRLSREEASQYFLNRKAKGFNVIQAVAISEFHDRFPVNYYRDSLFEFNDPLRPAITKGSDPSDEKAYDYWDHLEYIVRLAEEHGLYLALLPTWGEWVIPREKTPLFNELRTAYQYGWFISNRLKHHPNIIWILGGDRHPDERDSGIEFWRAMAEGLADGTNGQSKFDGKADYSTTLMTHHSYRSSSDWFHQDEWIDFHMWGSYHSDFYSPRSYKQTASDRALQQPKPTINGEPCYEDHPVNYALAGNGVFADIDVRNAAYWTFFSGGAGFTYGAHPIWQFADSMRPKYSDLTVRTWQEALDLPGASDMVYLRQLLESSSIKDLVPDQSLIVEGQGTGADYVCAIRGKDHAFVYVPTGSPIAVKGGVISGDTLNASWFDPRTGKRIAIGKLVNKGTMRFRVPGISEKVQWLKSGRGCDWVLVLENKL